MSIPQDLKYTEDHEWVRINGNVGTIGITDHAQQQLGDVVYIELPEVDDDVTMGDAFGSVESTKAVSDLNAPLSGTVIEINEPLLDEPETVNSEPYTGGWMIKIEFSDTEELESLLSAEEYAKFLEDSE